MFIANCLPPQLTGPDDDRDPALQAQYAFVIHTVNPSNGNEEEVYAELVAGLGEAIVSGMVPGASLSFVGNKADLDNPTVRPSFRHCL